MVDPIRSCH
ncbi:hypothetical protein N7484_005347 [Penicillium longicatenatum]|nr:hypothetical protein N7484_005347 [Penicillium longicatenatum]